MKGGAPIEPIAAAQGVKAGRRIWFRSARSYVKEASALMIAGIRISGKKSRIETGGDPLD
jgi:hypothetical protein